MFETKKIKSMSTSKGVTPEEILKPLIEKIGYSYDNIMYADSGFAHDFLTKVCIPAMEAYASTKEAVREEDVMDDLLEYIYSLQKYDLDILRNKENFPKEYVERAMAACENLNAVIVKAHSLLNNPIKKEKVRVQKISIPEVNYGVEDSNEPLTSIPWQLCPKCNGDGNLARYNSPNIISTDAALMCDVCNGAKVILQFVPQPAPVSTNTGLQALVLSLIRCSVANNPTDAVLHQITRLEKHYSESGDIDTAKRINEIVNAPEHENFKIVQSSLPSVSEGEDWISVEDGLPELGDEVISIDKDLVKKLSKYTTYHENSIGYMEGKRDKWFQYIEHGYAFHHHHVTHWCYQPAPPKGNK